MNRRSVLQHLLGSLAGLLGVSRLPAAPAAPSVRKVIIEWDAYGEKGSLTFPNWRLGLAAFHGLRGKVLSKYIGDKYGAFQFVPPAEQDFILIREEGRTPVSRIYGERQGKPFEVFCYAPGEGRATALALHEAGWDWMKSELLSQRWNVKDGFLGCQSLVKDQ